MRRRCSIDGFAGPRLVLSLCAKERVAVAAGNAPEGVPGATGIRSPDAPPVLTEPISVASGSGAVVLTECSIVRVALAPSLVPRGFVWRSSAALPGAQTLLPAMRQKGSPMCSACVLSGSSFALASRFVSASGPLAARAPSALADAQRPLREWFLGCSSSARHLLSQMLNVRCGNGSSGVPRGFLGCSSSALSDGRLVLRRCSMIGTQHGSCRSPK